MAIFTNCNVYNTQACKPTESILGCTHGTIASEEHGAQLGTVQRVRRNVNC